MSSIPPPQNKKPSHTSFPSLSTGPLSSHPPPNCTGKTSLLRGRKSVPHSHPPSSGICIPALFYGCAHTQPHLHQTSDWPLLPPHRPGTAEMGASLAQPETGSSRNGELAILRTGDMSNVGRNKTPGKSEDLSTSCAKGAEMAQALLL